MVCINRNAIKIALLFFTALLVILIFTAAIVGWNDFSIYVHLLGEQEMTLEYGEIYEEPGAEVYLRGTVLFQQGLPLNSVIPVIEGQEDFETLGIHTVSYRTEFFIWHGRAERTVCVVDTQCPVIRLEEGSDEPILPGTVFQEPGFTATDNHDGDITDRVIRQEQQGVITYAVIDSSGNPAYAQREVPYYDPIPPEIHLEGDSVCTITVGSIFSEPGFTATDNADGDLTESVQITGEVDWLTPGTYPIQYSVADTYGNETTVSRTVEVNAIPWPDTQWPDNKTIYLTFDDGPGPHTHRLLNILDKYGAKATFFVVGSGYENTMKEIVSRGHSIGIHSVSHNYAEIYSNPAAYFDDLLRMQKIILDNTGVQTSLLRFPGGGSNLVSKNTCEGIMSQLTWAVRDAGFQYFDWNVDSDDAGSARTAAAVRDNVITGIQEVGTAMVLMHDIHGYSVDAVEEILRWGNRNGYTFRAVQENTPGFHHDVLN